MAMTVMNAAIEIKDEQKHILKCLEAIREYCQAHYIPWLASQDIRVMLTSDDGSQPVFAVCGDGDVWYMPHDRVYSLLRIGGSGQSIYAHLEEGIALVGAWSRIKANIDTALEKSLKRDQSFIDVQV